MSGVLTFLHSLGIPGSWDVLVAFAVLIGMMIYGLAAGRDRVVMFLLSVYISLAIVTNAPILSALSSWLKVNQYPGLRLTWFLGLFFLLFIVLWQSHLLQGMIQERGRWWEILLMSVLQTGLTISVVLFLLPAELTQAISPVLKEIFLSDIGRSAWLILPVFGLLVIGRSGYDFELD